MHSALAIVARLCSAVTEVVFLLVEERTCHASPWQHVHEFLGKSLHH